MFQSKRCNSYFTSTMKNGTVICVSIDFKWNSYIYSESLYWNRYIATPAIHDIQVMRKLIASDFFRWNNLKLGLLVISIYTRGSQDGTSRDGPRPCGPRTSRTRYRTGTRTLIFRNFRDVRGRGRRGRRRPVEAWYISKRINLEKRSFSDKKLSSSFKL